jgi:hypothetical protein
MDAQQVAEHARERLGTEIQAVTRARAAPASSQPPKAWSVLTEHGYFWLVEQDGEVELFRMTHEHRALSARQAVERFLNLHPEWRAPSPADRPGPAATSPPAAGPSVATCRRCEAPISRRRQARAADPGLCTRCAHAERMRLRYQNDPEYRARRSANTAHLHATRRRPAQERGGS